MQARQRETATRQAVIGPHRDDISIRLHGMPASEFASEGQQRTIALEGRRYGVRREAERAGRFC